MTEMTYRIWMKTKLPKRKRKMMMTMKKRMKRRMRLLRTKMLTRWRLTEPG